MFWFTKTEPFFVREVFAAGVIGALSLIEVTIKMLANEPTLEVASVFGSVRDIFQDLFASFLMWLEWLHVVLLSLGSNVSLH